MISRKNFNDLQTNKGLRMSNSDSGKKEFQKWIDSLDKDDRTLVDKLFIYQQQKHDSQAQLGDIRQEVRQLFEQIRWINQMNNKCPDVSYETLFDWTINYGPDLTSIFKQTKNTFIII